MTETVTCLWCEHADTGEGFAPYDAIIAHQIESHGQRAMACGCAYDRIAGGAMDWVTCDAHAPAYIRQIVSWQIANYHARRWAGERTEMQPTLDLTGASA